MTKTGDKGTASGRGSGAAGSRRPGSRSGRTRERALQREAMTRSEASLRERNAFLEALHSVSEALAASQGLEGIIRASTRALGGFVGSPAVAFFWVNEPAGTAVLAYAEGFREDTLKAVASMPLEGSLTGIAVRERRVVGSQDVAGDSRLYAGVRGFLKAEGMQGALCVPIMAQEEVIGSLNLLFQEPPELEPHRLDTLMTIGRTVGLAISNARRALTVSESEERFRDLFQRHPHPMWVYDLESFHFLEVNEAALHKYGFTRREFLAMSLRDLRPESEWDRLDEDLGRPREALESSGPWVHRLKNGRLIQVEISSHTLEFDGRPAALVVALDVTDLRKAQEEMRLLSTAIAQSHEAACVTDPAGGILYVNPAMEALTGYSRDELLGRNPRLLKSGAQDSAFYKELWETILSGAPWSGRVTNRRRDGGTYEAQMTISPVLDEAGGIAAFVATQRDVTAEVALQRRLEEARELQTIGMIAGGVAHEVRNPLFAIQTVVAALERKLSGDTTYGEYLAHIKDQSRRLNTLMVDLLTLGRPVRREEYTQFGLRALVREAVILAENGTPDLAESCLLDLPQEPVPFTGHRDKLTQVLVNLIQNALSFSPAGEKITVRLTIEGPEIVIRVIDRGPGIPADLFGSLFEPFQTRRTGGTGLGLAIVRRIVGAHGGTVQGANNDPPPGATFTVRLPSEKPPSAPPAGGEA